MEDTQVTPPQSTGFSVQPQAKNSNTKWLIIFVLLLILGGAGIFFFTKSSNAPIPTPTPSFGGSQFEDEVTSTPTPTPASVDKEKISIEVQNGTGTPGEAAFVQGKLKSLGYTDIKVGNASSTDNTDTVVTFAKNTPLSVQDEIKTELEKSFKKVVVKTSASQTTDVLVVTGTRTTGSSTASTKPTSTAKASSSPKPSATASPKPTAAAQ